MLRGEGVCTRHELPNEETCCVVEACSKVDFDNVESRMSMLSPTHGEEDGEECGPMQIRFWCPVTRKLTSALVCRLGTHLLLTQGTAQITIALSSGEAAFYGMVRGASRLLRCEAQAHAGVTGST